MQTDKICQGGRNKEDFSYSGTGEVLWVQKRGARNMYEKNKVFKLPLTTPKPEDKVRCTLHKLMGDISILITNGRLT